VKTDLELLRDWLVHEREHVLQRGTTVWTLSSMICTGLDTAITRSAEQRDALFRNIPAGPLIEVTGTYEEGFAAGVRSAMALARVKP